MSNYSRAKYLTPIQRHFLCRDYDLLVRVPALSLLRVL